MLVFKLVMKVKVENYPIFLLAGLFPWQWIANSVGVAPNSFIGNASLIKKLNFPRNMLCLVVVLQDLIHFVAAIPVIIGLMFFYGLYPGPEWLLGIPVLCVAQILFTYSLNLLFATINLFFRDMEKLLMMLMTFLFFLTPVVYKAEMVPEKYQAFLYLNPAAGLIISWRELFLNSAITWDFWLSSLGWGIVLFTISSLLYDKLKWRFAEII